MKTKATLLIIDDDATLTKALDIYFARAGYDINIASNGADGLRQLYELRPDLVVLDIMMPQLDGWDTLQRIREMSTVPVIMLTAHGDESDRIRGLRMGADDYVPKPFSLRELGARVEAVLRRTRKVAPQKTAGVLYITDDLVIDSERWEVRRDGARVDLTSTELRLLFYLAANAGRVLSHHQILEEVWGPEYVDNVDYTKLFVWRLRQKIELDPTKPEYIVTERGIGYRMRPAKS